MRKVAIVGVGMTKFHLSFFKRNVGEQLCQNKVLHFAQEAKLERKEGVQ